MTVPAGRAPAARLAHAWEGCSPTGQAGSAMKGTAAAGSRCIRRCQLLSGANDLGLDYFKISTTMDNSDGGATCCTACYAAGYM